MKLIKQESKAEKTLLQVSNLMLMKKCSIRWMLRINQGSNSNFHLPATDDAGKLNIEH
jgi:hypothetical protein